MLIKLCIFKVEQCAKEQQVLCLEASETINRSSSLEDTVAESIHGLVIQNMSILKSLVKKCRWCCFKKRSCTLNRQYCSAYGRRCSSCNKPGHFPQSLVCNKRQRKNPNRNITIEQKPVCHRFAQKVNYDDLKLIKQRIKELEAQKENMR